MKIKLLCLAVAATALTPLLLARRDPNKAFEAALKAPDTKTAEFERNLATLRRYSEFAEHETLLEGIKAARSARDVAALKLLEQPFSNQVLQAIALTEAALCRARHGDCQIAIEHLKKAINLAPNDSTKARWQLANLAHQTGLAELSTSALDNLLTESPSHRHGLTLRAIIHLDWNRCPEALRDLNTLLESHGGPTEADPGVMEKYVTTLTKCGDTETIEHLLSNYWEQIPGDSNRASLHQALGQSAEALKLALKPAGPRRPRPWIERLKALELVKKREFSLAEETIIAGITLAPRDIRSFETAAEIFELTNNSGRLNWARDNCDTLRQLKREHDVAALAASDNINDIESRRRAMQLSMELGDVTRAMRWKLAIEKLTGLPVDYIAMAQSLEGPPVRFTEQEKE